jgi:TetR/AcrR family transcriptional repressor of mexJK operon
MSKAEITRTAGRPKSQKKRGQILHSAAELFLQQGFAKASMDAVAKESGVSKQTVYSHFANKDALFNAVIETKCEEYRIEDAAICIETQALTEILELIGLRFTLLLNDENVVAMYKVVIAESKPDSPEARLFYEAGPVYSCEMVENLLMAHPQSKLNAAQAKEVALDFFNLMKGDFHMLSLLHLPYEMTELDQMQHAKRVAEKTIAIIELIKAR